MKTQGKYSAFDMAAVKAQGKGSALGTAAVKTQGKGSAFGTAAVKAQSNGGVLTSSPSIESCMHCGGTPVTAAIERVGREAEGEARHEAGRRSSEDGDGGEAEAEGRRRWRRRW